MRCCYDLDLWPRSHSACWLLRFGPFPCVQFPLLGILFSLQSFLLFYDSLFLNLSNLVQKLEKKSDWALHILLVICHMESEFIPLFIISQTLRLNVMGHLKWSFIMLWVLIFNPQCKHNKKWISSIFQQQKRMTNVTIVK